MFELQEDGILKITLPEGRTQHDLIGICKEELANIQSAIYGKDVKINGRCTTAMALFLGHRLAHSCKSVSIFDPKDGTYVLSIWH